MQSEVIGQYRIEEELGRGGMGVVYRAVELTTAKTVALKVLFREFTLDRQQVRRFKREATALARLDHPNIVRIQGVGEDRGTHYYAMDFVEGTTLAAVLDAGERFDIERALDLAVEVASALGHAHNAGIIHRDIKPGNILIDRNGMPKLTDFGIARITYATRMTRTGDILGTPEYMSPEQGKGTPVDKPSDVYSLGVVLYELLAGKVPFEGPTALEVIKKHQYQEPENVKDLNRAVPEGLARIIMKMLAKDPNERYKSAYQAATALAMIRPTAIRAALAREKTSSTPPAGVRVEEVELGRVRPVAPGKKQCPRCHTALGPDDRICIACGTDLRTGRSARETALKRTRKRLLVRAGTTIGAAAALSALAAVVILFMGIFYAQVALVLSILSCIVTMVGGAIRRESIAKRVYLGLFIGLLVTILYGLLWDTAPAFDPLLLSSR